METEGLISMLNILKGIYNSIAIKVGPQIGPPNWHLIPPNSPRTGLKIGCACVLYVRVYINNRVLINTKGAQRGMYI